MSQPTLLGPQQFLVRKSFVELNARERAQALLDEGSYRELLDPFERLESPPLRPLLTREASVFSSDCRRATP